MDEYKSWVKNSLGFDNQNDFTNVYSTNLMNLFNDVKKYYYHDLSAVDIPFTEMILHWKRFP